MAQTGIVAGNAETDNNSIQSNANQGTIEFTDSVTIDAERNTNLGNLFWGAQLVEFEQEPTLAAKRKTSGELFVTSTTREDSLSLPAPVRRDKFIWTYSLRMGTNGVTDPGEFNVVVALDSDNQTFRFRRINESPVSQVSINIEYIEFEPDTDIYTQH